MRTIWMMIRYSVNSMKRNQFHFYRSLLSITFIQTVFNTNTSIVFNRRANLCFNWPVFTFHLWNGGKRSSHQFVSIAEALGSVPLTIVNVLLKNENQVSLINHYAREIIPLIGFSHFPKNQKAFQLSHWPDQSVVFSIIWYPFEWTDHTFNRTVKYSKFTLNRMPSIDQTPKFHHTLYKIALVLTAISLVQLFMLIYLNSRI